MNKAELINAIAKKTGLTKVDSKKALDAALETISEEIKNGGKVTLVGFGTFMVSQRQARRGVNPQTKRIIQIPAKNTTRFKPGIELSNL